MNPPTPEQIAKLPKWAQDHIEALDRQRHVSIRALNEYLDNQTESPFRYWDYVGTGEGSEKNQECKTHYIQTGRIEAHWAGVQLTVLIRPDQKEIDLQWCRTGNVMEEVAFIPSSFNSAKLKSKENMR